MGHMEGMQWVIQQGFTPVVVVVVVTLTRKGFTSRHRLEVLVLVVRLRTLCMLLVQCST